MRARYFSTIDRAVSCPLSIRFWRSAIVASSRSKAGAFDEAGVTPGARAGGAPQPAETASASRKHAILFTTGSLSGGSTNCQPPPRLRRSAEASAKAEALCAKAERFVATSSPQAPSPKPKGERCIECPSRKSRRCSMRRMKTVVAIVGSVAILGAEQASTRKPVVIDVTVSEGTSMSVGVSPDGRTLAIDLQGSIWTVPSGGGRGHAHHRPLQRRPSAQLVARRQVDRLLRLPRRRLRPLGGRAGRIESAQAHLGRVRRSRAGLVARRHARRVLVGPRQSAGQRLQHLDRSTRATAASARSPRILPTTTCRAGRRTTPKSPLSRRARTGRCGR